MPAAQTGGGAGGKGDLLSGLVDGTSSWKDLSYAQRLYVLNNYDKLAALWQTATGQTGPLSEQEVLDAAVYEPAGITADKRVYTAQDLTTRRDAGDKGTSGGGTRGGRDPGGGDGNPGSPGGGRSPGSSTAPKLSGEEGKDYHFVKGPNGKIYVVYSVKTKNGQLQLSWSLTKEQIKQFGVNVNSVQTVTAKQFQNLHYFGTADQIVNQPGVHPLQMEMKDLQAKFGNISWMQDPEALALMLDGWMEGKDVTQELTQTDWYKNTTEAQRIWETKSKADRVASIATTRAQIADAMDQLYGEVTDWQKTFSSEDLDKWAKQIASGKFGSADAGFQSWFSQRQKEAEQVEGSQAWIDKENLLETERAFMNRPEDMFEKLRTQALNWLGASGPDNPIMSNQTLKSWANDLVTGKKSEADWDQFIRKQARDMYPYLGTNQTWQEFADPYKAKTEQLWGKQIDWSDPVLADLMGKDANGKTTGQAVNFSDFETALRGNDQFWQGDIAQQEGYGLITKLDSMFNGVNY